MSFLSSSASPTAVPQSPDGPTMEAQRLMAFRQSQNVSQSGGRASTVSAGRRIAADTRKSRMAAGKELVE